MIRPVGRCSSSGGMRPGRDLALGVAGGRREAQPRDGLVALGQLHQEALDARPAADADDQQPGGERVQRPRVADLHALAQAPPDLRDDVVRRHARPACRREECRRQLTELAARDLLAQELHQLVELEVGGEAGRAAMPAAAQRPRDHRDVDAVVGRAQRDLARRLAVELLAHEPGDRGALDRAQVVDDALGVALVGARGAVVVARQVRHASAGRRRSARRWRARAPAARACPAGCPRRGAGRPRARRCPAAISSAAISCARGPVFSYMKRPVSVTRPTYSASPIGSVIGTSSPCIRSHTISAVHDACGSTWLIVPKRVLSWWWSMLRISAVGLALERLGRRALDVAAVQEDQRALAEVRGRLGRQALRAG